MKKQVITEVSEYHKRAFWQTAKALYPDFAINEQNFDAVKKLLLYFTQNKEFAKQKPHTDQKLSLNKGIMLIGNPGAGKSALMRIFQILVRNVPIKFFSTATSNLHKIYQIEGEIKMNPYTNMLYEDLNIMPPASFYGAQKHIPEELVYKRHEFYIKYGTTTHFTSNQTLEELAQKYGLYITDRLLEMCNIFKLGGSNQSQSYRPYAEKPTAFVAENYAKFPTFFQTVLTEEEKIQLQERQEYQQRVAQAKLKAVSKNKEENKQRPMHRLLQVLLQREEQYGKRI
jgi:energy-coupling factor transporter ATP-binding protein EcfA2